jgi:hypothetical protein
VAVTQTPNRVNLDFVDLLYAVPVAALATRVGESDIEHLSSSTWGDIGLALIALTLGWIGHHSNRWRRDEEAPDPNWLHERPFTDGSFWQFWIEVLVIGAYFALSARLSLPGRPGTLSGQLQWKAWWLLGLFGLYLLWDTLDATIAYRRARRALREHPSDDQPYTKWARRATHGGVGTALFVPVFVVVRLSVSGGPYRTLPFDLTCIGLLYAYRISQHAWIHAASSTRPTRARAVVLTGVALVLLLWVTGALSWAFSARRESMMIRSLQPSHGPVTGRTPVVATGEYFDKRRTTFRFGTKNATKVRCESDTRCSLVAPVSRLKRGQSGKVGVVASLSGGEAKSKAAAFFYDRAPQKDVPVQVEMTPRGRVLLRRRLGPSCHNDDLQGLLASGSARPPLVLTFATADCRRLHLRVTPAIGIVLVTHRVW